MSPAAQTRLLRVIEQRELTRVGGTRPIPLDVRVVSATNRELGPRTTPERFRTDLFYRLGVLRIRAPALRERTEDVPVLAAHFLSLLRQPSPGLSGEAIDALVCHSWPGNVRELRNVMERAALAADGGRIRKRDLQFD
jgi:DNA-binding NtrC family response regulator